MPNNINDNNGNSIIYTVLTQHFNNLWFSKPLVQPFYVLIIRENTFSEKFINPQLDTVDRDESLQINQTVLAFTADILKRNV